MCFYLSSQDIPPALPSCSTAQSQQSTGYGYFEDKDKYQFLNASHKRKVKHSYGGNTNMNMQIGSIPEVAEEISDYSLNSESSLSQKQDDLRVKSPHSEVSQTVDQGQALQTVPIVDTRCRCMSVLWPWSRLVLTRGDEDNGGNDDKASRETIARCILSTSGFVWTGGCGGDGGDQELDSPPSRLHIQAHQCTRFHQRRNALCNPEVMPLSQSAREKVEEGVQKRKKSLVRKMSQVIKANTCEEYEVDLL